MQIKFYYGYPIYDVGRRVALDRRFNEDGLFQGEDLDHLQPEMDTISPEAIYDLDTTIVMRFWSVLDERKNFEQKL